MRHLQSSGAPRREQRAPHHDNNPDQGDLFQQTPGDKITQAFLDFHRANPQVWDALRQLALEWKRAGKTRCGISLLYNTVRWQLSLKLDGDGVFELNDHYQPYYARALMHFVPELRGMFELRSAPAADAWIAQYQDEEAA